MGVDCDENVAFLLLFFLANLVGGRVYGLISENKKPTP
jgi:hypothetical protein